VIPEHPGIFQVVMVQRSATCVTSFDTADKIMFSPTAHLATEDGDFMNNSMSPALALQFALGGGTQMVKAMDRELHEGLTKSGFKLTWEITPGGGEVGFAGFFFNVSDIRRSIPLSNSSHLARSVPKLSVKFSISGPTNRLVCSPPPVLDMGACQLIIDGKIKVSIQCSTCTQCTELATRLNKALRSRRW
jgi:hypothetical protein